MVGVGGFMVIVLLQETCGVLTALGSLVAYIFKIDQQDNQELFDKLNGI
jgi:hypothetical protein